ncbi:MBL fold metallo-hydrolase [Curtobacterium sp. 458]|uniref:MBL fold metallo-hydrolase n=1 Tax=Curtobacterium sp. 458 TaxID=3050069 RepID=UPI0025B3CA74|nr:MBL fold metallo-hydrolase [Curtobacterium sp. 458]WJX99647.1 MBL fold metallo-hydrolase [Curtobacterium sp. 458]
MRELTEVAPGVLVATSRTMSTTSTVIHDGRAAFLVDPAWMPDELAGLASTIGDRGLSVTGGFATHAHHDHLLWHPGFGAAPRFASAATAALAVTERPALLDSLGAEFPRGLVDLLGRVTGVEQIPEAAFPRDTPVELVVHDGHAPGHTALWLPEQRVLLAGDMLSDIELPLPFWPDDLPSYRSALDVLARYAEEAAVVVPGHGEPGPDALARLDADRRFLDDVAAGRVPNDPRLTNPGMAEVLDHLRDMSRR